MWRSNYKLTNYLAVKKDKTGYFYVRNLVDTAPAIRLMKNEKIQK